jgi:hypothetical protein
MFQNRKELRMNEKKIAIRECYYLWKLLSRTGSWDKPKSIHYLYKKGLLHNSKYAYSCPLCEFTSLFCDASLSCDACPIYWPRTNDEEDVQDYFCCHSYYRDWDYNEGWENRDERKRLAGDICGLIEEQYPEITKEVNQDEFIRSLER